MLALPVTSPDYIEIQPVQQPIRARIRPPGSKSITNRALVCVALADGNSTLKGALDSEDTRVMISALRQLGLTVKADADARTIDVVGCGGRIPASEGDLHVGNSGTTVRFLTALLTLGQGQFRLDGTERMRQRPIEDLLVALRQLGADVRSEAGTGCPPVIIRGIGLGGGRTTVRGDISSQFLSALLMAAPGAQQDVELIVEGELVSKPYVQMTLEVMRSFGVRVHETGLSHFTVPARQTYQARTYEIEPDASAASYFWGAAAITGGEVAVEGLSRKSLQGDVAFCECLDAMGCQVSYDRDSITVRGAELRGIDVNMNAISDTVQTLGAVALYARGPTTITGVAHIRHKETDRIGDLARELRKFGADVEEFADGLKITPPQSVHGGRIDTYKDHRMAMSLALVGLRTPGVVINDPGCTEKTYPNFFLDLASVSRS